MTLPGEFVTGAPSVGESNSFPQDHSAGPVGDPRRMDVLLVGQRRCAGRHARGPAGSASRRRDAGAGPLPALKSRRDRGRSITAGSRDCPESLAAVRRQHPTTGMLVVLPSLDAMLILEAMRAGRQRVPRPPGQLEPDLRARHRPDHRGATGGHTSDVFAFVGAKGGVGATTVAVNVAATLASAQARRHAAVGPARDLRRRRGVPRRRAALLHGGRVREHASAGRRGAEGAGDRDRRRRPAAGVVGAAGRGQLRTGPRCARWSSWRRRTTPSWCSTCRGRTPAVLDALDMAGTIILVANQELSTVRSAARISSAFQQRYGEEPRADRASTASTSGRRSASGTSSA